jgi:hypothetical protein
MIGKLIIMNKLVFLLKSYHGDFEYANRLVKSYLKHNPDEIPLYIVVPKEDLTLFKKLTGGTIFLINEESITKHLVNDFSVRGIRPGYINQEIIKLAFWETNICENYFCVDSDAVFIRNFYMSDFMYNDQTPYSILSEDNELKVDPEYYRKHWVGREILIREIQKEMDYKDSRMLTCHSFAIFSSKVLSSFKKNFLDKKKLNYIDIIRISPYEFSWYNTWLLKNRDIEIQFKEPLIKFFHQKTQHLEYLNKGVKIEDIARGFIGYNINSNYSRSFGLVDYYDTSKYLVEMRFREFLLQYLIITKNLFYKIFSESKNFFKIY